MTVSDHASQKAIDVDDSFSKIVGGFGRYQIFLCLALSWASIPICAFSALPVFVTANITALRHYNHHAKNDSSILLEWDSFKYLWQSDFIQAFYFLGFSIGAVGLGQLSDKFSRLLVLKLGLILLFAVSLCSSFSISWEMFAVFRFFTGLFGGGSNMVLYVLMQEQIGSDWWAVSAAVHFIFHALGFILLPVFAYLIPPWRRLIQFLVILETPTILFVFFSKQSPRWLLSKNRIEEAEKVLVFFAKRNGVKNPVINLKPVMSETTTKKSPTFLDVVTNHITLKRFIATSYLWLVSASVYYSFTLASGQLYSNVYLSESLTGLVDLPVLLLYPWLISKTWAGRKRSVIFSLLIASAACFSITPFKSDDTSYAKLILGLLGKFFDTLAYSIMFVYTPELFPTTVRNVAMGAASMFGRIGGILSSFTETFIHLYPLYAYLTFGACCITAAMFTFLLPETVGRKPPNTFEDLQRKSSVCIDEETRLLKETEIEEDQ